MNTPAGNSPESAINETAQELKASLQADLLDADLDAELADGDFESEEDFEDEEEQDELTEAEGDVTFASFELPPVLAQTLADMGYTKPTPVQAQAIPFAMQGRDILATAQTGTGKTAAFAIPLLNAMLKGNRAPALILAPTRELAEQTAKVLGQLTQRMPHLKTVVIIGGSSYQYQTRGLKSKPAFVVGTPGRLIDQAGLGNLKLGTFGSLVLDEADRMLDMGFAPQLEQLITQMPAERHTMLFSATLPNEIKSLAARYLKNPERIACGEVSTPVDRIKQEVIEVENKSKGERLLNEIDKVEGSLIIFTRTKTRVEQVMKLLMQAGHRVARIHGDRSQRQRGDAIREFRDGYARILVATDIAARGIDIPHIKYVVNFDLPLCPEDYIHRIGRTARAGAEGTAWAFVTPEETFLWARIYKMMYGKYPEGWDRRRSGGNRTMNQRPNGGGRGGGRFGGGRGNDRFGSRDGGRPAFGGARGASAPRPYGNSGPAIDAGGYVREGAPPPSRPSIARPVGQSVSQTGGPLVAQQNSSASSQAPAPARPTAFAPIGSRPAAPSRPVTAPAPAGAASTVAKAPPAPKVAAADTGSFDQPAFQKKERSSFHKNMESSFEQRERPEAPPSANFASEILASAEAAHKTSEAPAGMNRAARRASKFSDTHREAKAREGSKNEDSQLRSGPRSNAQSSVPRASRPSSGNERNGSFENGRSERPSRPSFGGGSERPSRPSFGGGERSERPSRPSFGGGERSERPSRPSFGGGSERSERPSRPSFGASSERPSRPSFGGGSSGRAGGRPAFGSDRPQRSAGEARTFSKPAGRPFAPRGEQSARPPKRFDRPARDESGPGERPPSKRGRFAERLSEMLGR